MANLGLSSFENGKTWPQLSWTQLAPQLLELGPEGSRSTQIAASNWRSMRQLHTKLSEAQHEEHCPKQSVIDSKKRWKLQMKAGILRIWDSAGNVPYLEAKWVSTLAKIAPKWIQLRA